MKWINHRLRQDNAFVAPVRERGLKYLVKNQPAIIYSRSREGAWIEIKDVAYNQYRLTVAPVRERGLKSVQPMFLLKLICRSREGAWIEIHQKRNQ